jgi:hypothetical protein
MNNQEAKLILSACRPGGEDLDDASMRQALDVAENDPELASWLSREQTFDAIICGKLAAVPVPANLKAEILAAGKVSKTPVFWRDARTLISAAAAVALAAVVVWKQDVKPAASAEALASASPSHFSQVTLGDFRAEMAESFAQLQSAGFTPDLRTDDEQQITDFLRQRVSMSNAPDMDKVVDQFQDVRLFGCRIAEWRGRRVSMICLSRDGEQAHLFVIQKGALTGDPEVSERSIDNCAGYPVAAWRDLNNAYVLVGHKTTTDLKRFL